MAKGPSWIITLRARPGSIPPYIRLRRFLKLALRAFQLVAEDVREVKAEPDTKAAGGELVREN